MTVRPKTLLTRGNPKILKGASKGYLTFILHLAPASVSGYNVCAGATDGAKSFFTQAFPEYWLYALGLIFILVTLFMPQGIVGLLQRKKAS